MTLTNLHDTIRNRAERRLDGEGIIWVTTVRPDGQPQTSPVGFVWDGARFLILSEPTAPKVRNLRSNPKVALHLDLDRDATDGGVLTLEGVAEIDPGPLGEREAAAYVDKYLDDMRSQGLTPEEAFGQLATVIRVTPTRVRSY